MRSGFPNGTNGIPISFKVLPMVPLVIAFVPMVMPMVTLALPMEQLVPLVSQWYHWLPMVPLLKLPMVPLGETRTEPFFGVTGRFSPESFRPWVVSALGRFGPVVSV